MDRLTVILIESIKCGNKFKKQGENYGGPQLSHQIQITPIKYNILTSKTRLNGQRSENENHV